MCPHYVKPQVVSLRNHPVFNERWLQDRIAEDPTILGLGELVLRDRERPQPTAGRLDLLLQDPDTYRRFEVEIQLGATDASHIIRTIEYWDIERRRYPQYDHCAVIVAEDITSRFLNVISLFNGQIPLVAIKLQALQVGEEIGLVFTKVLDEMPLGLVDDDEEVQEVVDRSYWVDKATAEIVEMADQLIDLVHEFDRDYELKYNKFYIGLAKHGQPNNFALFHPKKTFLRLGLRLPFDEATKQTLEEAGLDLLDYNARAGRYRIRLFEDDIHEHAALLTDLMRQAYEA